MSHEFILGVLILAPSQIKSCPAFVGVLLVRAVVAPGQLITLGASCGQTIISDALLRDSDL